MLCLGVGLQPTSKSARCFLLSHLLTAEQSHLLHNLMTAEQKYPRPSCHLQCFQQRLRPSHHSIETGPVGHVCLYCTQNIGFDKFSTEHCFDLTSKWSYRSDQKDQLWSALGSSSAWHTVYIGCASHLMVITRAINPVLNEISTIRTPTNQWLTKACQPLTWMRITVFA